MQLARRRASAIATAHLFGICSKHRRDFGDSSLASRRDGTIQCDLAGTTRSMRCLLVADLHYSLQQYDWVTEVAGDFDVVVIAGDHLDLSSMVDFRAQSVVVRKYIAKLTAKTQLLVCSGNHDLDTRDETGEKVSRWILGARDCGVPCDGDSFVFSDTLFTVCPWWDGPTVRGAIEALLAADAKKRPRRWIWVHHAPPASSATSWDGVRHHGDADLRRWILQYRPDFVLCGHVHQSPFRQGGSWADCVGPTWVFNAGHQFGRPPAHVILDCEQQRALWFSAAGNQIVRLDRALRRPIEKLIELPGWLAVKGPDLDPSPA